MQRLAKTLLLALCLHASAATAAFKPENLLPTPSDVTLNQKMAQQLKARQLTPLGDPERAFAMTLREDWVGGAATVGEKEDPNKLVVSRADAADKEMLIVLAKFTTPNDDPTFIEVMALRSPPDKKPKDLRDLLVRQFGFTVLRENRNLGDHAVDDVLLRKAESSVGPQMARLTSSRHGEYLYAIVSSARERDYPRYKDEFMVAASSFTPGGTSAASAAPAKPKKTDAVPSGPGLHEAAQSGDTARIRVLLGAGTDANATYGDDQLTALMLAAQNGHLEIVRALIKAGADTNAKASNDSAALLLAALRGHTDIVRALLAGKANPNVSTRDGGWTPLIGAAQHGHTAIVQALIAARADINASPPDGWNALLMAAQNGHLNVVQTLIAGKANVEAATSNGWTALIIASQHGHLDVVRALLSAKAKVNVQTPGNGVTALFIAAQNGHTEVVRALLAAKANSTLKASNGTSPLAIAKQQQHAQVVALLQQSGAQ